MIPDRSWVLKISEVFDVRPRNGTLASLWLSRKEEDQAISTIVRPNVHLCIDGPTGTGKSSLAITALSKARVKYVAVPLSWYTSWAEFCQRLVEPTKPNLNPRIGVGLKAGMDGPMPVFEGQVSLEIEPKKGMTPREAAAAWTENDVFNAIARKRATLLIDNFERATNEMVTRIADMAKLFTEKSTEIEIKLVIVGTDDIFRRLLQANRGLEGRITETSVGAFSHEAGDNVSWGYLVKGFEALGLIYYPGSNALQQKFRQQANDSLLLQKSLEERDRCKQVVFEAADNLPKSLTELGYEITLQKPAETKTVGVGRIIENAEAMIQTKVMAVKQEYPKLRTTLKKNLFARKVLGHLLNAGTGRIHSLNSMVMELSKELGEDEVRDGVQALKDIELLVQTGQSGDTLFFSNPSLAHTLRILAADPVKCRKHNVDPKVFAHIEQISLPFEWDT